MLKHRMGERCREGAMGFEVERLNEFSRSDTKSVTELGTEP